MLTHKPKTRYVIILLLLLAAGLFYFYILKDLPSPTKLAENNTPQSTQIFDRNGILLYTIYGQKNQIFTPLPKIPKSLQEATISIEDKNFYNHGAIDLKAILRSVVSIVTHNELQGGSTLTQQLVKNSLLSPERTIPRKIKEVVLSFATEVIYPKDKILEMYLNQSPYGGTAWGVEAASEMYFGKHVWNLDLAQSAMLAGLPNSPTTYSPYGSHPELGKLRQKEVLKQMLQENYITQTQYDNALKETLHFQSLSSKSIKAPHWVFYIKDLLTQKYGSLLVEQGGLKVITSLDLNLQDFAQATVAAEVAKLTGYHVSNGAALITKPSTGEILAMVGSKDYFDLTDDGNVNLTTSLRQPGSSIKPINYVVGIINGFGANTPFIDEPTCFGINYCPHNYDGKFHGVVTMRQALGNSFNIPAVKMLKVNGPDAMISMANAMGISTFNNPNCRVLSLTLGSCDVTMLDMATAFGVFANNGYRVDLHPILKITDKNGKILEEYTPTDTDSGFFGQKVLPSGAAYIISNILADNNARMLEFGPSSSLKIANQYVSAKTGTTNDFRDNWTFGYTPSYLVATWVGNNDNTPMQGLVSGITGAAPMWHDLMSHILEGKLAQKPAKPSDVIYRGICMGAGVLSSDPNATNKCPASYDLALQGTPQRQYITTENTWIDKGTNDLAKPGQTTNVDLKSETVLTDPTGAKYCLSCPHPTPTPTP